MAEAARAARGVGKASETEAARTRARIEAALLDRKPRLRPRRAIVLLVAAGLATASAWAATATRSLVATGTDEQGGGLHEEGPRAAGGPRTAVRSRQAPRVFARTEKVPPPMRASSPVASGSARSQPAPPLASGVPGARGAEEVDALYATAHEAHFVRRDPARALEAWNTYLRIAPRDLRAGLVLEARYNRAICLLRLGRRDEARDALRPFAEGVYGDYRKDDARVLIAPEAQIGENR